MNDVVIEKRSGGLGRRNPSGDMISGLLCNGVSVPGGVQKDTVYRLRSTKDALGLLIDSSYDSANNILVFEHIDEFFRVNPDGDLYILIAAQSVSYADLLDKSKSFAVKLLSEAEGNIKRLGVAFNPTANVTDFSETQAAIAKAQELATQEFTNHRPVQIHLEGKGFDLDNPVNFRSLNSKNVSVVIGQAHSVAQTNSTYAAIGTELGARSKASVNENIGWIAKFNLYGGSLSIASIAGKKISSISQGTIETLNDYGAIFLITHTGVAGLYFNDGHTCTALTSDFAYQELNEVIDKAARMVRIALLPRLNSPVHVDSTTGQLSPEVIKSIENEGKKALEEMLKKGEVSAIDIFIDPNQNILATSELQVEFDLIPTGTSRTLKGIIGFTNPF